MKKMKFAQGCFNCGEDHNVSECPTVPDDKKGMTPREWRVSDFCSSSNKLLEVREARRRREEEDDEEVEELDASSTIKIVQGSNIFITQKFTLDSGADFSLVGGCIASTMRTQVCEPVQFKTVNDSVQSTETCTFDYIEIGRKIRLNFVQAYVLQSFDSIIIGNPELRRLGIDPQTNLSSLYGVQDEDEEISQDQSDGVTDLLRRTVRALKDEGLHEHIGIFSDLIRDFPSIFREGLDASPPIAHPDGSPFLYVPRLVRNDKTVHSKLRRYTPREREFIRSYVKNLVDLGLAYPNRSSRWSTPIFLTPKKDTFRFTLDFRAVNFLLLPMAWQMPLVDTVLEEAVRGKYFASLDCDNGYWQIAVHPDFAEIFSFLTEDGIFTPTRLLQGIVDGVAVFQGLMSTILVDFLHKSVIIWIDDLLVYAADPVALCKELRKLFTLFQVWNVKINPRKTTLFTSRIKWCGKIIQNHRVAPDDDFVQGLVSIPVPKFAGELQQFLSAANWIRTYISRIIRGYSIRYRKSLMIVLRVSNQ